MNIERKRLERQRSQQADWRLWGPYLSERAWGTVREDYSPWGSAWEYFSHDQARMRAYRWNEDGLGGISDEQQRLCFALALWNGRDPILKERAFGLTGNQGNRGEDVKEYYFYLDATPSHSRLHYRYKYPQAAYPYERLVQENAHRSRQEAPFTLLDSGVFEHGRYWDVDVEYAKQETDEIHIRITAHNRGDVEAELHLLPTLWFRNTWSWDTANGERPTLVEEPAAVGAAWTVAATHAELGSYRLYGAQAAEPLFTENESNTAQLWSDPQSTPYTKDAFHRRVVDNQLDAVNPARTGSKFAAWHRATVAPGASVQLDLVLSARALKRPFSTTDKLHTTRRVEADQFYRELLPGGPEEDARILRQALAGMIWSKQFFHYDVERWLEGDRIAPPDSRKSGRNARWKHLKAHDVISMPDAWEYPWFAAWDLAFHCSTLALVDIDFAKDQVELMISDRYLHPNGQMPAYEWAFADTNPPVHAMAALKCFRAERVQRGEADHAFLKRVFHKLLLNYTWWINQKDRDGQNIFEGGFLGLDNISVFDRSHPLPEGFQLKQADATGWMAMFSLNLVAMALELATEDGSYESIAIQVYRQFIGIADSVAGNTGSYAALWDPEAAFFKDLVVAPDSTAHRVDVYSWVGLIPLFACEIIDERLLANVPVFRETLAGHAGGVFRGNVICACPHTVNERGEHLLSVVDATRLQPILARLLDQAEFLSPFGIRSVSRIHAEHRDLGVLPGVGQALIEYVPGESNSGLFGGNSNWRGPIWFPTNYALIQALEKFHRYLGDGFRLDIPGLGRDVSLAEAAHLISERLVNLFRRDENGQVPSLPPGSPFQSDPHWRDLLQFYEYFHGDNGQGLGAAHQTGWTGLVANLVLRQHREEIPIFWRRLLRRAA
jgi:hypothetical protein